MQERYIAAADLGSSKIGLTVAKVEGEHVEIIYYKETPSDGIFYSYVRSPKKAAAALRQAIQKAEEDLKIKLLQLVVGLPRYKVHQEIASAKVERTDPGDCISKDEIEILKSIAIDEYPINHEAKEVIFSAVAQSFSADEDLLRVSENDVIGVTADYLEGNFKVFIGGEKPISNIDVMLNEVGIAMARKIFTPNAIANTVLSETERENGVALVEFGAGVTSLTIFKDNLLRHYSAIPFGSKSITTDIKYECGFNEALAENIKLAYGACMPEKLQSLGEKILQINDDESGSYEQLPVKYLSEIITCRAKEIVEAVLFQIQASGYADHLRNGVVITGGGAELVNLNALIKAMSGYTVRIGYPRPQLFSAPGCPEATNPSAAASIGMILESKKEAHLNCTVEFVPEPEPEEENKPEGEETPADGTLFGDGDVIAQTGTNKKSKGKSKDGKPKVTWTKRLAQSLESVFDNTMGSIFDGME